jgi:hypothetical protein
VFKIRIKIRILYFKKKLIIFLNLNLRILFWINVDLKKKIKNYKVILVLLMSGEYSYYISKHLINLEFGLRDCNNLLLNNKYYIKIFTRFMQKNKDKIKLYGGIFS